MWTRNRSKIGIVTIETTVPDGVDGIHMRLPSVTGPPVSCSWPSPAARRRHAATIALSRNGTLNRTSNTGIVPVARRTLQAAHHKLRLCHSARIGIGTRQRRRGRRCPRATGPVLSSACRGSTLGWPLSCYCPGRSRSATKIPSWPPVARGKGPRNGHVDVRAGDL
jgi:hypothetical protein